MCERTCCQVWGTEFDDPVVEGECLPKLSSDPNMCMVVYTDVYKFTQYFLFKERNSIHHIKESHTQNF